MRKSYIACALLLALCVLGVAVASAAVQASIDDVAVWQTCLSGDPAAAKGLEIYTVRNYDRLFWKMRIEAGGEPMIESDFLIHASGSTMNQEWLTQPLAGTEEMWGDWQAEQTRQSMLSQQDLIMTESTMESEVQDEIIASIAAKIEPGTEKTVQVRVKDYYDYYTYTIRDTWYAPGWQEDLYEGLIRRPVEEDYLVEFTVGTYTNGAVCSVGYGTASGEDFIGPEGVWMLSAPTLEGCFIVLNFDDRLTPQEDWFPHGYGLFYVPWTEAAYDTEYEPAPRFDQMHLVIPMDLAATRVACMSVTPDGRSLQMITCESGVYWLTSVSAADGAVLQRRQLPDMLCTGLAMKVYDDFMVLKNVQGDFAVYTIESSGAARWDFTSRDPGARDDDPLWSSWRMLSYADMAYADGKLAVSGEVGWYSTSSTLWVQVYDSTGLLYSGQYELSLDRQRKYENDYINPFYDAPQIRWES